MERTLTKGRNHGKIFSGEYSIELLQAVETGPNTVEALIRAWHNNKSLGFGDDGSVEIERAIVHNLQGLVKDPNGSIMRGDFAFRNAPDDAYLESLFNLVPMVGKKESKITKDKVGRTSYTIYATPTDTISSGSATYSTARSGGTLSLLSSSVLRSGQDGTTGDWTVYEAFMNWDTSVVSGTVSSCLLGLYLTSDDSAQDFTLEARVRDFGGTVDTADFVAGASLSGLTLVAQQTTASGLPSINNYFDCTDVAFTSNVSASNTRILASSSRQRGNNAVATGVSEFIRWGSDSLGGTTAPRLTITATAPGGSPTPFFFAM